MSNPESQSQIEQLDEEGLRRIVSEVVANPEKYPTESRLILTLERWHRQGSAYDDKQTYDVVMGEVKEVILEEFDEGYPYRRGYKAAIIPLTVPVVIDVYRYDNTTSPEIRRRTLYIFTGKEWKCVDVY